MAIIPSAVSLYIDTASASPGLTVDGTVFAEVQREGVGPRLLRGEDSWQ